MRSFSPVDMLAAYNTAESNDLPKTPAEIYPCGQIPSKRDWAALGGVCDRKRLKNAPGDPTEDASNQELDQSVRSNVDGSPGCDECKAYYNCPSISKAP